MAILHHGGIQFSQLIELMWNKIRFWRDNDESVIDGRLMKSTAQTPNVIDFPLFDGKVAHFAKLDGFVMTVLAGRIGFEGGAYALHMAGYEHIGDIAGTTPQEIGKVQGIGPRKLEHIRRHLQALGLDFGQDVSDWREYRKRFPDAPPDRPATYSPGYKRRRHLRLVVGGRAFQPEPA